MELTRETNTNTNTNTKNSYLEIFLGCMYSGKTSKLVEIYKQCKFCNINVAVINHCFDKRAAKHGSLKL